MQKRNKPGKKGLKRIWNAFLYALAGLKCAFRNEAAFRQEILIFVVFTAIAIFLPVASIIKLLLILSIVSILVVELINSAIESVVDKASPEQSALAKQAKDMSSSAVLITLLSAISVWLYVLITTFIIR